MPKEPMKRTLMVTAAERPARKLILARSVSATDYFSFCEEMGCEWESLLDRIDEKFDAPALLTLPKNLVIEGTGRIAFGVEVPLNFEKPLPNGCEMIDLPPCVMLYFQGAPFEDPGDFGEAIGLLWELMKEYDPKLYGFAYEEELAPSFSFGAAPKTGAKMAMPAKKYEPV